MIDLVLVPETISFPLNILSTISTVTVTSETTGVEALSLDIKTTLNLNSEVKDLILNSTDLGVLNVSLSNNVNISDNYKINLSIIDDKRNKIIQSDGNLYGDKINSFDIDFDINDLDISFLSKLSEKSINEIEGLASGNFKLIKINNKITHKGSLNLKNAKK